MRLIVRFGKIGRLRYISHLDLQRFMQRALRRTDLPVAYSQGFNPHAVMSFASALAMGWSSECEMLDVKLAGETTETDALARVRAALPPEMPVYEARLVPDQHPALMARLAFARYAIQPSTAYADLSAQIEPYLAEETVIALRKTKSGEKPADIRKMTRSLCAENGRIEAVLMLTEAQTLKPDLLIQTLAQRAGIEPPQTQYHRLALYAQTGEELIDLFRL